MERCKLFLTGSGGFTPIMDDVDRKLVGLLGNRATPLSNAYDSSAEGKKKKFCSYFFVEILTKTDNCAVIFCSTIPFFCIL